MPTRMTARESNIAYAVRRAATVDTSAVGDTEPSFVRNTGSLPPVASNRAWISAGVIVQPSLPTWQVAHDRPFVPSDAKNGSFGFGAGPVKKVFGPGFGIGGGPAFEMSSMPAVPSTSVTHPTRRSGRKQSRSDVKTLHEIPHLQHAACCARVCATANRDM